MSVAFAYSASVNDASPVIIADLIFVSASYEIGAAVVRVQGSDWQELWSSDEVLSNHYATSLYYDGNLYGFHGRLEYNPSFRGRRAEQRQSPWERRPFWGGTVTLAGIQAARAGADPPADGSCEHYSF